MAGMQHTSNERVLRYPDNLGQHPELNFENATNMLMRAPQHAAEKPFVWTYIDRPSGRPKRSHIVRFEVNCPTLVRRFFVSYLATRTRPISSRRYPVAGSRKPPRPSITASSTIWPKSTSN